MQTFTEGISVILTAHNEEDNIELVIVNCREAVEAISSRYEIIVVNDGSTDATRAIVERIVAKNGNVKLINHQRNLGVAEALRTGFAAARHGYVFYTDADGQFDVKEITTLLPFCDEYDFVVGYRQDRADPFHRKLNAWLYNLGARLLLRVPLRDVDCAFKLMRREQLNQLRPKSDTAFFLLELMVLAHRNGVKIHEVPVHHYPRRGGQPHGARLDIIWAAIKDFIRFFLKGPKSKN